MFETLAKILRINAVPQIFFVAALVAIVFVAFAIPFSEAFAQFFGRLGDFTFRYLGWFYVLSVTGLLIFLLYLAFSRTGDIRLGQDHEMPAYSTLTWFVMLFAAGIGTILMFWGVAEPLSHFVHPPFAEVEPRSLESAKVAMNISLYHFGLHTWTIFTLPALAIGYFSYRKNLPLRISSVFYGLLGERIKGPAGWSIDISALLGTLLGVAVSVGLGTLQLNAGLFYVLGVPVNVVSQVVIVLVITAVATMSVALGMERGIKRLSYLNIALALALLLLIWVVGPSLFITSGIVQNLGMYFQNLLWMSFWTEAYQQTRWQQSWTVFYWAWTIAWAPYVGMFIARISRGRTIRQLVLGALGAPLLFTLIWFSVFGLAAIDLELHRGLELSTQVKADVSLALFTFLQQYPLVGITSMMSLLIIIIFLTTSADSAALVMDLLSRREDQASRRPQRVFWMLLLGSLSATLLLGGGLTALQNLITAVGFPFCIMLLLMAFALAKALHDEAQGKD